MHSPADAGGAPFWPRRSPNLLALRRRVRTALPEWADGPAAVTVGVSGGADSLALLAATCAEARGTGAAVCAAIIDHGLQPGSADVAALAAATARRWGAEAVVTRVRVDEGGGPEDAARRARHAALHDIARARGALLLLAHTADDQAETVLLSLARGASPAGLAGMAARRTWADDVTVVRPLLLGAGPDDRNGARRATTRAACAELGVTPHEDPHNTDARYARVRVRHQVLPALAGALGDAAIANLARAAELARGEWEALEQVAVVTLSDLRGPGGGLRADALAQLPAALRARVLRLWLGDVPAAAITQAHLDAVAALACDWHGQGPVHLPGATRGLAVRREGGTLSMCPGVAHAPGDDHDPPDGPGGRQD